MLSQRVRGAGIRAVSMPQDGPLRVQSKASAEYSATRGHASVAGDMLVSRRGHDFFVNQGGIADKYFIRP